MIDWDGIVGKNECQFEGWDEGMDEAPPGSESLSSFWWSFSLALFSLALDSLASL